MATLRPISYNPSHTGVTGTTESVVDLTVGFNPGDWSGNPSGLRWWNTPDLDLGYVIAHTTPAGNQPTQPGITPQFGYLGFWRTKVKTTSAFISLAQWVSVKHGSPQTFGDGTSAKTWLNTNGYWTSWDASIPLTGLVMNLDVWDPASAPGTGTIWYDLTGNGNNAHFQGTTSYDGEIEAIAIINDSPGNNAYLSFPATSDIPIGNSPYTISIWYNSSDPISNGGFIGWGAYGSNNQVNALRQLNSGGNSAFVNYWWNNDLAVVTPITSGTWYNLVATYNGAERKIYLNASQIAADSPVGHNVSSSANMTVGVTNSTEYFWGFMSQVLVYDVALDGAEIQQVFDANSWRYGY